MQNKVTAVGVTIFLSNSSIRFVRRRISSVPYAWRLPRYRNCLAEQAAKTSPHPSRRRREPQPAGELRDGTAARRTGAVRNPAVARRNHVPQPQATEQEQQQQAAIPKASWGSRRRHHHQREAASNGVGGGGPGVAATAARGEQRRRHVRPAADAAGEVERGGRGRGADARAQPAGREALHRRRGVAGAAGGAARQRVQPQAGPVRHHTGEAHGAAPRAPQALLRPLQQRHQRKQCCSS